MDEIRYGVSMARDFGVEVEVVDRARIARAVAGARSSTTWSAASCSRPTGRSTRGTPRWPSPRAPWTAACATCPDTTVDRVPARGRRSCGSPWPRDVARRDRGPRPSSWPAGLWTSELARLAGADVALYPAEHVWVMTDETGRRRSRRLPFLRDLDGYLYIRHYRGRFVIGAFEPNGKPMAPSRVPTDGFAEFGPDWDHFAPVLAAARVRVPALESIGFDHYLRAAESFTPDSNFQLGFVPGGAGAVRRGRAQLAGDHLRAGRRAGGRGVDRRRSPDDGPRRGRRRADGVVGDPASLAARADGRVARRPVRDALAGQAAGHGAWAAAAAAPSRPPGRGRGVRAGRAAGSGRCGSSRASSSRRSATTSSDPSWFPAVREEVRATREAVALYDLTTYAKFLVAGTGRARRAAAAGDVGPRHRRRADRLHGPRQRARRHRDGPDDHAARRRRRSSSWHRR